MIPPATAYASVAKQGVRVQGLNATPTGSTNVTIANFTGIADVNLTTAAASAPLAEWLTRTDSATLGTTLLFLRPGQYTIHQHVAMGTAVRIQAGILRGSAAAPANPLISLSSRVLAAFDVLGAAAGSFHTVTLTTTISVADNDIPLSDQNQIRFMYSNGAGAAPVGLVLAENGYTIWRGLAVQSLA